MRTSLSDQAHKEHSHGPYETRVSVISMFRMESHFVYKRHTGDLMLGYRVAWLNKWQQCNRFTRLLLTKQKTRPDQVSLVAVDRSQLWCNRPAPAPSARWAHLDHGAAPLPDLGGGLHVVVAARLPDGDGLVRTAPQHAGASHQRRAHTGGAHVHSHVVDLRHGGAALGVGRRWQRAQWGARMVAQVRSSKVQLAGC